MGVVENLEPTSEANDTTAENDDENYIDNVDSRCIEPKVAYLGNV